MACLILFNVPGKLNIHPSLLPKFRGLHAVKQALDAGEKETGCTVHYVDEDVDTGPIIMQEKMAIQNGDSVDSLHKRIHKIEHALYPKAIVSIISKMNK